MSEISKTADKAIMILIELAAMGTATPQQLCTRMSINRTVVQRLLTTLVSRGFVGRAGGEYSLSPRLRKLATSVQPQLRRAVGSHATALSEKTQETVVLHVFDGDSAVVLQEVVPVSDVRLLARHEVGARNALTQSASGLAMLAALADRDLKRVLRAVEDDGGVLDGRVRAVRAAGIAVSSDELQEGVSGIAVALRRGSDIVGSIAILTPTSRSETLMTYAAPLQRTAARIERAIKTGAPAAPSFPLRDDDHR